MDIFKESFSMVSIWGSHLDKDDGVIWDISPNSIGNVEAYPDNFSEFKSFYNYFDGGDYGKGHDNNPFTNQKYETQLDPRFHQLDLLLTNYYFPETPAPWTLVCYFK